MSVLRRAYVTRVSDSGVYCTIPSSGGPDFEFGPLERAPFGLNLGDRILVGQTSGELESFVVVAPLLSTYLGNQVSIHYFEDEPARDAIFPGPNDVPTFVWIDDLAELQVWTDEGTPGWVTISWDDDRVADIEDRLADLEAVAPLTTLDTATVDLELSVGNQLTASVKANSIPLNDLSDVVLTSPADRASLNYDTGTSTWIDRVMDLNDLGDVVITSPALGHIIRHNGTNFFNLLPLFTHLDDVVITSVATGDALRWNGTDWINRHNPFTCTSTTRPASPVTSDLIFETDTGFILIWSGAAWVPLIDQNTPTVKVMSTSVSATNTTKVNTPLAFSAAASSFYVVQYDLAYTAGTGGDLAIDFTGPASFTFRLEPMSLLSDIAIGQQSGTVWMGSHTATTSIGFGGANASAPLGANLRVRFKTSTTAGTITLRIGQVTTDAGTPTVLLDLSAMVAHKST